jgi:hypothetical protein
MNYVFNGPSLRIGELNIEGADASDLPSIVAGLGCGNAKVGPAGSIDRLICFPGGSGNPTVDIKESLQISSQTKISSVLVKPWFSILGSNDPTKLPFPIRYRLSGTGQGESDRWQTLDPSISTPVELSGVRPGALPSGISFDVSGDQNFSVYFQSFLQSRNFPAIGFLLGFSIISVTTATTPTSPSNLRISPSP